MLQAMCQQKIEKELPQGKDVGMSEGCRLSKFDTVPTIKVDSDLMR
jgi:hypothetical protein